MLAFQTEHLGPRERADAMASVMSDAALSTNLLHEDPRGEVHMRMAVWQLGPVELVLVDCSGVRLVRTPRQTARDGAPVFALGSHAAGRGVQLQDDRAVELGPGRLFAVEMTRPYDHRQIGAGSSRVLKIPAEQLGLPPRIVAAARPRLAASPVRALFQDHFAALVRRADRLGTGPASDLVGAATVELARALLATAADEEPHASEALESSLVRRVKDHIRRHLQDPTLNPEAIAGAHHVSVRHLYKVCAAADLRVEQWIITERLEAARRDLSHTEAEGRSIAATARRWGFTNSSHFTHRFRDAYGMTPREWQRMSVETRAHRS
jgi:AraC-like DNA-binding protein